MPGTPMPFVKPQFLTDTGAPAAGYQLFVYDAGTTTKQNTWQDQGLTTLNTNPIVLDSAGRASIFLAAQTHRFKLATPTAADPPAAGDTIWDVDDVPASAFYDVSSYVERVGTRVQWTADGSILTLTAPDSPVILSNYYVNNGTGSTAVDIPAGTLHDGSNTLGSIICEWEVDYASADLEARVTAFGTNIDRGSGSDYTSDTVNSTATRARVVFNPVNSTSVYYSMTVLQNTDPAYEQVTMAQGTISSLDLANTDYTVVLNMASGTFTIRGARVFFLQTKTDLLG